MNRGTLDLKVTLGEITALKTRYNGLIGTAEAYRFLKWEKAYNKGPNRIAEGINAELQRFFDNPTYVATPERIWGLCGWYVDASGYMGNIDSHQDIEGDNDSWLAHLDIPGFTRHDNISVSPENNDEYQRAVDYFSTIFLAANISGITTDDEIGAVLSELLERSYQRIRERVPEDERDVLDGYFSEFSVRLQHKDWGKECSEETYREDRRGAKKIMRKDEYPSVVDMAQRVRRDRTYKRVEERRDLLRNVLDPFIDRFIPSLIDFWDLDDFEEIRRSQRNWENLARNYDLWIEKTENEVKSAERGEHFEPSEDSIIIPHDVAERLKNALREARSDHREELLAKLENLHLIRDLIGQERRWIEKILNEDS